MKFEKCETISFVSHCSMNSINSKNSSSRDWQLIGRLSYAFIGNLRMRNARSVRNMENVKNYRELILKIRSY